MTKHFEHTSTLVTLDGQEFFVDAADAYISDDRAGQMLCGWAMDMGREQTEASQAYDDGYEQGAADNY